VGKRSPRHYIATKFKQLTNTSEKTPGPGAYNNLLSFTQMEKGVTIATKLKTGNIINVDEKSKIPGPASYMVEKALMGPARPKFSFPREQRNSESKMSSNFPDPASYTPKLLKHGPAIT
jgi:Sperm-tail PG-rich repeat